MNVQLKLYGIVTALAVASCLWFTTALTAVGDSPIFRLASPVDGYYYPLPLVDKATGWGLYAFVGFSDTRNDFVRMNPDGSRWIHFQAVRAYMFIAPWDGDLDSLGNIEPWFAGSGKATGSFTVDLNWTADLHQVEWRWEGKLTEMKTGDAYPFFLHVVAKDGVFLRDDVRFAPLGLGD